MMCSGDCGLDIDLLYNIFIIVELKGGVEVLISGYVQEIEELRYA